MISRGVAAGGASAPVRRDPEPQIVALHSQPAGPAPDINMVHYRLAALERLSLLRDKGALSQDEFAAEKALVLRLPAEELMLEPEAAARPRGPSLLGRLFSLKLLAAGAAAGICVTAFTAPGELSTLVDQAVRLAG